MNNFLKIFSKLGKTTVLDGKNSLWKGNFNRFFCNKTLDVNTNVVKDVILYKSDQVKFYRMVNMFGLAQFVFWTYLSATAYKTLKDIPVDNTKATVWWRKINFGESKWRNSLTTISFLVGWGILATTWMYTLRSVRYVILRKGGKEATIVTYGPLGKNRMITVNLSDISAKEARSSGKSFVPIKVKGHYLHYMVDIRGEFKNPVLFDHTAGFKRSWTN